MVRPKPDRPDRFRRPCVDRTLQPYAFRTETYITAAVTKFTVPGLEPFPVTSPYDNPPHVLLNIHNSSRAKSVNIQELKNITDEIKI